MARHLFRNVREVYETLHANLQAICVTQENRLPHSVIVANSAANRLLDDAAGFLEVGYIPSKSRLQHRCRGSQDVYINIGMGIAQIVQGVGTGVLAAEVSALLISLEVMEKKVNLNAKETKAIMRRMSTEVQYNSFFDQVGQIMEMIRLDGRELTNIARSMTKGMLDAASERDGARIISRIAAPLSALLSRTKVQDMITTMSKAQGAKIDSRQCSEATRRVSFITAQPMIAGTSNYVKEHLYFHIFK